MKILAKIFAIGILLSGMAAAQCTQATIGTNCNSPMSVSGSTAAQSSVGLTDNGAASPAPAPSQYWLSIDHGTIRLSANGQPYVLPGMPTNYVLTAQAGGAYSQNVGAGATAYTAALTQIDMTLPQQVRLMISSSSSCPQCSVQAQYYNGAAWANLTNSIIPTKSAIFVTAWTSFPSGANGDYAVRLAINNSGTVQATVGLHSAMLQFK